jgi:hypothetical protein
VTDKSETKPNPFWPAISDLESAIRASDMGYGAAIVVAVLTAAFATYAAISGDAIASIDAWAYLDSVLFALIAWRIRRRSRAFAVIGLLLFVVEKMVQYSDGPPGTGGVIMALLIALYFVAGIRGTFAIHRIRSTSLSAPEESPGAGV